MVDVNPVVVGDTTSGPMANYKVSAKELSNLMRLTFDNTTVEDVQKEVSPVFKDKLGGVEGILKALAVEKDRGTNQDDFSDRQNMFGENKVEQDPQVCSANLNLLTPCNRGWLEQRSPSLLLDRIRFHPGHFVSMVSYLQHAHGGCRQGSATLLLAPVTPGERTAHCSRRGSCIRPRWPHSMPHTHTRLTAWLARQEPLWKLMWQALQDPTLIFLTCAALISLAIGVLVEQKPLGWLEGVAILFAVTVPACPWRLCRRLLRGEGGVRGSNMGRRQSGMQRDTPWREMWCGVGRVGSCRCGSLWRLTAI